jgi:amidase
VSGSFIDPLRVACEVPGAAAGPLAGTRLAVKDIVDVAGIPTGAGNPAVLAAAAPAERHATAVQRLLDAGATVIGKAHTDEFAFSFMGTNHHYGTPRNPAAPGRIPGGSSCGSASAVASGLADIAIGTDTGGSIRVPSSYCGLFGLRPTHGRIPLDGVWPLAPSFDTIGPLADNGDLLQRAGLALLQSSPATPPDVLVWAPALSASVDPGVAAAVHQAAERLIGGRLLEVDATADPEWAAAFGARQLVEAWASDGDWMTAHRPPLGPGVASRFERARALAPEAARAAGPAGEAVRAMFDAILPPGGALVLPSAVSVAPAPGPHLGEELRPRLVALCCLAGLAGAPAVSLPLAAVDGLPVGVCLVGRPGDDERLLAAAAVCRLPREG